MNEQTRLVFFNTITNIIKQSSGSLTKITFFKDLTKDLDEGISLVSTITNNSKLNSLTEFTVAYNPMLFAENEFV